MASGHIVWFNPKKGYGFIRLDDGREVFVHRNDMENKGIDFDENTPIECEIEETPKGLQAINIVQPQWSKKANQAYKSAVTAQQERRYELARELFERAIQLSPNPQYFSAYAGMEIGQDNIAKAREILEPVIGYFPQDVSLYDTLGKLERKAGNLESAAEIFRQGLRHDPQLTELHRLLAYVLMDMNNPDSFDEAEEHFQIALHNRIIQHSDPKYSKLKLLHTHTLGRLAWQFLLQAGFEAIHFRLHPTIESVADMVVKTVKPEYIGAYDLTDSIFVRCFSELSLTFSDISRASNYLHTRKISRNSDRDLMFVALKDATHLRDALYRQLEKADQPAVVPLEEAEMRQALQANECESTLCQILDQWLYRRDLYKANIPVAGRRFFGREAELAALVHNVDRGQHTGVFGLRKVGKTSLLYQLREIRSQDLTAYVDLQATPPGVQNTAYIYWNTMNQWHEQLEAKYPDIAELATLRLGGKYESYADLPSTSEVAINFDADSRALHKVLRVNTETGDVKLLLLLDEVERLLPNSTNPLGWSGYFDFFTYIRGLSQETGFLVSVLAAANPSISEEAQLEGQDNPVFQFYEEVYLPLLKDKECFEMIEKLGRGMGLSYTTGSLQRIYQETGGHPFIARQLCSRLSSLYPRRPLRVTVRHVKKAMEEFLFYDDSLNKEILSRLETLYPQEKDLLLHIAKGVTEATELAKYSAGRPEEALRHLVGYQLVTRGNGNYQAKIGLLNRWIQRHWLNLEN